MVLKDGSVVKRTIIRMKCNNVTHAFCNFFRHVKLQ